MTRKPCTKLVSEGEYVARVDVDLLVTEDEWSPCLDLADAYKLDEVREALRSGDIRAAARLARVYQLVAIAA